MFTNGSFVYGYNKVPWSFSDSEKDRFYIEASPLSRPLKSLKQEYIEAAKQVGSYYHGEEIHLFYGGGIDSESMVEAFRLSGVPFKVICVIDKNGLNRHELEYAHKYFNQHEIDNKEFYEIDSFSWINSFECYELAREAQTTPIKLLWPYEPILNKYSDRVILLGNGQPEVIFQDGTFEISEEEYYYSHHKVFMNHSIKGTPSFLSWSNELFNCWLFHIQKLLPKQSFKDFFSENCKSIFLEKELGLLPREKVQWHYKLPNINIGNWTRIFTCPIDKWHQSC